MTARRSGGVQLEIVSSLFVLALAGLTLVAVVMGGLAARRVDDAALERLRLGSMLLERAPGSSVRGLADVAALARTRARATLGGHFRVADDRGYWVGAAPQTRIESAELLALIDRARIGREAVQPGGVFRGDVTIVRRLRPPQGGEGFLIGSVAESELRADFDPVLRSGGWVLLIATLVFVGFGSYLLRRRIAAPLRDLAAATARVATGDLDVKIDEEGPNELAELAHSFNSMAVSLTRQRNALVRAQESISRGQRLAVVGQLAAGVAHEVGNPVAAILGYADVARRDPQLSERSGEMVGRIHAEALRIRTLVRELLDLSRGEELEIVRRRPHQLVDSLISRMEAQKLLEGIEIEVETDRSLPSVEIDAQRFEQILVNLVENAAHATRGQPDPRVVVRATRGRLTTRTRRREDLASADEAPTTSADAVSFEVEDNGSGIDEATLSQVFDPFFTTKDPGEGTGLGLWNAHRLAELLGGTLEATSGSGRTCFRLILPCADTPEDGKT